ncbi:MAG: hypothetical protein WD609_16245, partial [Aquisalimonadaceae bacterium]
ATLHGRDAGQGRYSRPYPEYELMRRRSFVKACALGAGYAALNPSVILAGELRARHYERVRLVDNRGAPLRPGAVRPRRNYVFQYPYPSTPVFLLNLGLPVNGHNGLITEGGDRYSWSGGVGPGRSLVAFSAICAHKLAHPTPSVSYISFRNPRNDEDPSTGVISCCAENSTYDPVRGGEVISGPAGQPLAAVLLDYVEDEDALYATGTLGGELFQRFFDDFEARFSLEYPDGDADAQVAGEATVVPLENYSRNLMRC